MNRCVIVGGAQINNYAFIKSLLTPTDFYIYCDSGLMHQKELQASPNLIIGDFDSYNNPNLNIETIVLPTVKDDTDTVFAVKEAIKRGYQSFLFIGVVGGRLDHSLVNVYTLLMLKKEGKEGVIADDYSIMELVSDTPKQISDTCDYFSLLSITGRASGVTIKNAKYELTNGTIESYYQFATSNEVIKGKTAVVSVKDGELLLIKIYKDGEKHA